AGAMFHDMGLTPQYASADKRFEVDSANTARDFLRRHGIDAQDIQTVWTAIALHTTPGIPQYMHPVIALVTAGVEMDVLGIAFSEFDYAEREAVVRAHPRPGRFKEEIIQAFYEGFHHRPETTFGNVNADVLADKDPSFRPENFCGVIRATALKFYTEEGNWDLVGNNTPVFFHRDPLRFPDLNHAIKRDPRTGMRSADNNWDFWTLVPESLHQVTITMSDRGIPRSFRHMHLFGSHTFSMINA